MSLCTGIRSSEPINKLDVGCVELFKTFIKGMNTLLALYIQVLNTGVKESLNFYLIAKC